MAHVVGGGGQLLPALLLIARPHLPHLGRTFKVNTTQPAFALAAVDDNILYFILTEIMYSQVGGNL